MSFCLLSEEVETETKALSLLFRYLESTKIIIWLCMYNAQKIGQSDLLWFTGDRITGEVVIVGL